LRTYLDTAVADVAIPAAQAHMTDVRNGTLRVNPLVVWRARAGLTRPHLRHEASNIAYEVTYTYVTYTYEV